MGHLASATRRDLLASALGSRGDVAILQAVLRIEQLVELAYARVLGARAVSPHLRAMARAFASHERVHVRLLSSAVQARGGTPPRSPAGVAAAQQELAALHVHRSLTAIDSDEDALRLLIAVERLAEGGFYAGLGKLTDLGLVAPLAEIMAVDAQHAGVLAVTFHHGDVAKALPDALVRGVAP